MKVLKLGLIGAGNVSRTHLRAFQQFPEQLRLVAVCDIREAAARALAGDANVPSVYTDPAKMLRQADIDAVDICTVHDQHAALAIAAAEAGRHVLVEKPMACSMPECRAVVRAAERAGVTLMVAQWPISSGRDNLGTMKVVFGIYESARRGEAVDLSAW